MDKCPPTQRPEAHRLGAFPIPGRCVVTAADILRISDEADRAQITEAITHLGQRASREFPVVGTPEHPSAWDMRHRAINELLDDLAGKV